MNCGRSSSVEWKLPKLQRRVRFPSPAPAPPGHAPGGFVMPTSHPPSTECGGTIGATLSPRELGPAVPVQNSPHTSHTVPLPVQNSPRASWGPRFRYKTHPAPAARCQFRYKTHPARPKSPNLVRFALAGRVLSRFCCQQAEHGEFCPATTSNKTGTPPLPVQNSPHTSHTVPVPVQNSPHTSHTAPVPVQNSPSKPKISQFGAFFSCWESFIPFLSPTSRAWRVFSRTNTSTTTGTKETTPPHNTQSHAMKDYPPTLHTQHDAMKHLPPQHATNNKNSPIFTMQGRTFFHNTHHTPTPGRHFFQPTPLPAKETQTRPSSFSIASSLPGQTARTSRMAARSQHDEAVH